MPKQPIDCPVCGSVMQKRVVDNGVEIDFCDWHGLWLDAGELERLLAMQGGGIAGQTTGDRQSCCSRSGGGRYHGCWVPSGRPVGGRHSGRAVQ